MLNKLKQHSFIEEDEGHTIEAASDPARPSLINLSEDVLGIILDNLASDGPGTLLHVSLVNSALYHLSEARLHRCLTFELADSKISTTLQQCKVVRHHDLHSAVRRIIVLDEVARKPPQVEGREVLRTICDLLPLNTGLRELEYQGDCVPKSILATLARISHVALSTKVVALGQDSSSLTLPDNNILRLHACVNLRQLDVKIIYYGWDDCKAMMRPLKQLLLNCPGIDRLSLDVSQPSGVVTGRSLQYCGLDFSYGESHPALYEFTLIDYSFGKAASSGSGIKFDSVGYPHLEDEVRYWATHFDWSRLKRLETPNRHLATELSPRLVCLEEFSCSGQWQPEDVESFCTTVPSVLRRITAPHITTAGILQHSASIRELQIHSPETLWTSWQSQAANRELNRVLREECPMLFDLGIDVARSEA